MLSNGMTLYLLEDHELPLFNINGLIKTGDIYEPKDKVGLSAIFASVMRTGGTVSREPDALNEALESMAAAVEVGMSREYGTVSLSTLAEDVEKGLEIFADVLRNPAFREDKLELRKQQADRRDPPDETMTLSNSRGGTSLHCSTGQTIPSGGILKLRV